MKNRKILIVEYKTGSTGNIDKALKSLRYTTKKMSFRIDDMAEVAKVFQPEAIIVDMSVHADKNIIAKASMVQEKYEVPIIYYTEAINSRTLYQTMKTNHYGYIYSPYDESTLQTTIELALHKHKNDVSVKTSEHKYKELFNNMTSGVAIYELKDYGSKYALVDVNRVSEHILGKEREEMLGKSITEIFLNAENYGLLSTIKRVQSTSQPERMKSSYYEDENIKGWFNSYVYKLPAGEIVHIFHDITEQVEAENALKTKQKELEMLNLELAKTVVEETDKRKKNEIIVFEQSRFLAMGQMISAIAHQWRQPLSALGINIEDLEDAYHAGELDSNYIKELTIDSMELIKTISKTMDDLSSFFKSSRDEICFSINNIIDEVYSLMKARMVNSGISFNLTHTTDEYTQEATDGNVPDTLKSMKDIFIKGVPAEFKQVLINILNNSIDAILERLNNDPIHNDGNISFDIETRQSSLHIYIKDNGIGLTPETMKKVFEPYFTTKEGGTGIGLYMSKIIIEEHMKGRLSSSSLPQGAIFTINLPLDSLC